MNAEKTNWIAVLVGAGLTPLYVVVYVLDEIYREVLAPSRDWLEELGAAFLRDKPWRDDAQSPSTKASP